MSGFMRHWEALGGHTPLPPGLAFHLGDTAVGWVAEKNADAVAAHGCLRHGRHLVLPGAEDLPGLARRLADEGLFGWRDEAFDVRAAPGAPVLTTVDRGALPFFGIMAEGVHVNGLVQREDGLHLWVGRRAAGRLMDPGKLDHLIAGGIPAGLTKAQTLVKEGAEEAGLGEELVRQARQAGVVSYTALREEGLRRDYLHCYDLWLPGDVRPVPTDGEVAGFELWPIERVVETVRTTDDFKFNVNLVLIDLFMRHGLLAAEERLALERPALESLALETALTAQDK